MNKLFERAITEVAKLPEERQEAIASTILDEIGTERGWDERFAQSQDQLAELSRKAGEHIARGTTLPYDPSPDRRSAQSRTTPEFWKCFDALPSDVQRLIPVLLRFELRSSAFGSCISNESIVPRQSGRSTRRHPTGAPSDARTRDTYDLVLDRIECRLAIDWSGSLARGRMPWKQVIIRNRNYIWIV